MKEIEREINHDVKAIEYFLKERARRTRGTARLARDGAFRLHVGGHQQPRLCAVAGGARSAALLRRSCCRSRTGSRRRPSSTPTCRCSRARTASRRSPTTLGKELANFAWRLGRQRNGFAAVEALAQINGAVGNYNAHVVAYPGVDWDQLARALRPRRSGCNTIRYTTQIEPHDWIAEYCDALARFNTVRRSTCAATCGATSRIGYFRQAPVAGEVGSSTMPHKVNPIDFENAEGNLGIANALLAALLGKLPISRWQRDLSDSTVLRNLGVALAHSVIAYPASRVDSIASRRRRSACAEDLDGAWEVLAEAVQTVMRRYGVPEPYEKLKALTRGQVIDEAGLHAFVEVAASARRRASAPHGAHAGDLHRTRRHARAQPASPTGRGLMAEEIRNESRRVLTTTPQVQAAVVEVREQRRAQPRRLFFQPRARALRPARTSPTPSRASCSHIVMRACAFSSSIRRISSTTLTAWSSWGEGS